MTEPKFVPYLPETAPFTPEQRAYLNGFFAGWFSFAATPAPGAPANRVALLPSPPLTILFGSQTGNAEGLAKRLAKEAGGHGFAPKVVELAQYPHANLSREQNLLLITSTYGEGDPPDNAKAFWEFLNGDHAPRLPHTKFSVLALGDSNYPMFCQCGKNFDRRIEELGARRVHPRVDCDVDYEAPFQSWLKDALVALKENPSPVVPGPMSIVREVALETKATEKPQRTAGAEPGYDKGKPCPATLLTNLKLNGPGSGKDTRHLEIALGGARLAYEPGDALGVRPTNCPELAEEIIRTLGCGGEESVPDPNGEHVSLRQALLRQYEITRVPKAFLQAAAERAGDAYLQRLTAPGVNGELTRFLWGREIIDLLVAFPKVKFSPVEFVGLLKKLQPRLYSISSSPKIQTDQVHLTVGVVRYESLGRRRKGVCSAFLADRSGHGTVIPVFVQTNKSFRLPADGSRPIIMVGPGSGIAPFRAFLQERHATGASGPNWLFFGEQHEQTDFLYRTELVAMLRQGTLTRLDTAFSRDQPEKVYVQHRILEHAKELLAWLEEGAHFYVCGDAGRMAKDVDAALHRAIESAGGFSTDQAAEYVQKLKAQRRYQRDVY